MPRKCPITIGEYEFATKLEAKAAIRSILNGFPIGATLKGDEDVLVRDLVALHPATEDKIGCGIDHIEIRPDPDYGTTRCFHIIRVDGSSTDISFLKCIDGEILRQLIRPALRNEILSQILQFKKARFAAGPQTCPYTSELLEYESCHVDHCPPMTFETIVTQWLKRDGLQESDVRITERKDNNSTRFMTDNGQISSWTTFHQENARLRILSRRGNLSASKIEAGLRRPTD